MPLSKDVPNLSVEKCVRTQTFLCPPDCLWTPPTTQEDLANGRPMLDCYPSFCFGFWVIGSVSRQIPGAGSSLRSVAGLEDVLDESSSSGVEDELVPEFDKPGTRRCTKVSVFQIIFLPCLVKRGFSDRWPTHEVSVFSVPLSSNPFCSVCALMLRILELKTWLSPHSWACKHFRQVPCCSPGASFLLQGLLLWPLLQSGSARIALVRFTLLNNASRWTLSFAIFLLVPRALGECDGAIWSWLFSLFRRINFLDENLEKHNPFE